MGGQEQDLKERLENDFLFFCRYMFAIEYKRDFNLNWHHSLLAEILEDIAHGKRRNVIINIPPRYSKTEICVKMFIPWCIARDPSALFMHLSYSDPLSLDNSNTAKEIIQSKTFQEIWQIDLSKSTSAKSHWATTSNGGVYATSTAGRVTGMGAGSSGDNFSGALIIDDPNKPEDALSDVMREKINERFNSTISSRLNNPKKTPIILIMQRLHEDDLSGFLLGGNSEFEFEHISLPAICEESNSYDPRNVGEALWPDKHNAEQLKNMERKSNMTFAGQYQQRPAPKEGNLVKKSWIGTYDILPEITHKILVADLTFKKGELTDYACIEVWGKKEQNIYLIDQIRDRMDFPEQIRAIRAMVKRHKGMQGKYIEEAANGAAIISTLKEEIMGIIPVKPKTSKEARLQAVAHFFEGGNVYYPNPSHHKWVNINVNELISFPNAKHDDTVDCATMAVGKLGELSFGLRRLKALTR